MYWDYWRLLAILSIAGFIGLQFGQMVLAMFLALLVYTLWLQEKWFELRDWLQKPKKNKAPTADGVIDEISRKIEQVYDQNRSRKKKLAGYLKRFQSATAALPDAIVVLSEYGQIDWANDSAEDYLGIRWPKDNYVRVSNLIRDPAFQQLLDTPSNTQNIVTVASPKNSAMQLEIKLVRYMGSGRLLIARDITRTVKLQQMRRDFVANVSHELKTPLTVLRGYLETFEEDSPADQWAHSLPVMRQQAERMHLLIKDLLMLSQLETGEKPLHLMPTDVGKLLETIIEDANQLEPLEKHEFQLDLANDLWLMVDSDELRSALSNLVFNAVKYTPAQSKITLSWTANSEGGCIIIADDGEGIDDHHLDRLTERFYRVDSGRSQAAGGTGLGLAIVKHVLQRHGAELKIESELGVGSQFSCYFPKSSLIKRKAA